MLRSIRLLFCCACTGLVLAAPAALAGQPLNITVDDNVYAADLVIPGGVSAELTVTFENVVGLSPASLNVSVTAVNAQDPALLGRLGSAVAGIPVAFPLLLQIEPDPAHGLSFSGIVTIELYTHDLEFVPGSPLRLYSAPHGGSFSDITVAHSAGSYRTGGTKGNFSEFLIVIESRASLLAAGDKLQHLRSMLDSYSNDLDAAVYADLSGLLSAAESEFAAGSLVSTVTYVEDFADAVASYGSNIPNVWGSAHALENIAGKLRAAAGTLRFSLTLAINDT